MDERLLDRNEAAEFLCRLGLKTTARALAKRAVVGGGPTYRKFGSRCLYKQSDLRAWFIANLSSPRVSTSEQLREEDQP
jgi:hypothetical protein